MSGSERLSVAPGTLRPVLNDDDRLALTIAAGTYRYTAARERDALEQLGLTPTRFWARVHWIIEQPAALAHDAAAVRRLQRLRDARRAHRARTRAAPSS